MSGANKVLWSEGLFLRTQHFQQQDKYTESLVRGAMMASSLQNFGFHHLKLEPTALEAGRISIETASGVFPDGTPFHIPETMATAEPLEITADTASGLVHLALPVAKPGSALFDPAHAKQSGVRYKGEILRVRDAVRGGAEPEEIEIARPQCQLLAGHEDAGGYTVLAVAEIDGLNSDSSVALVEGFLPPALVTSATPSYAKLLQEVKTGLERIAEAHGEMVLGGAGRSVENLLILELANSSLPQITHMLQQDLFHPAELFNTLVGLAGRMATYGSGSRRLSDLPPYEHSTPRAAFSALTDTLRSLILTLRHVEPKSQAMAVGKHSTNVWKIRIDNPDILTRSRIVLRVSSGMSDEALRRIFVNQATVGSADEFEAMWKARLPGIALKPLHSQPREIPYDGDSLCLELDQRSEHWASLQDAPGFILGVSGSLSDEPKIDCYAVSR